MGCGTKGNGFGVKQVHLCCCVNEAEAMFSVCSHEIKFHIFLNIDA